VPPKKPSPPPPPPLDAAKNLRQTIANFDAIVAWAINASSGIGYFAAVYKRATIAMSKAIDTPGGFQHPEVMTRFTMTFSQRYFDALNAHFHPDDYEGPTHVWQWAFDGLRYDERSWPVRSRACSTPWRRCLRGRRPSATSYRATKCRRSTRC
jgi:hypothetical protein